MITDIHHHYQVILTDDDHEILENSHLVIETDPEVNVASIGFDESYVLDLVQTHHPDAVLMNVEIPKVDGIAATRQFKSRYPNLGATMLTNFRHDIWLKETLDAGVDGFLTKDTPRADPSAAIKHVAHGGGFMSTKPLNMPIVNYEDPNLTSDPRLHAGEKILAATERQVWQEALKGRSSAQIAKVTQSKESAIKTHMSAIMQKLSVYFRAELLVSSVRNGAIRE